MAQRIATSLRKQPMTTEDFAKTAFFKVLETDSGYFDLESQEWKRSPDKKSLVREDGSYISTVGKNYSIVENQTYLEGVLSALDQAGVSYVPKDVYVENNGKRTSMIVTLPQFGLYKGTSEEQDFELRIRNSFDTTLAADTIIGLLRLICTNGMMAFDQDFSFRMIHKGDVMLKAEQAIELYQNFEGVWQRNKQLIERLGSTQGDYNAVKDYIGDGEFSRSTIVTGPRWAKKLQEKWEESGRTTNLWALYNIFTYIASHEYGHNYTSKVNLTQKLNKEVRDWPRIMRSANVWN